MQTSTLMVKTPQGVLGGEEMRQQKIHRNMINEKQSPFPCPWRKSGRNQGDGGFIVDAHEILKQGIKLSGDLMGSLTGAEDDEYVFNASAEDADGIHQTKGSNGQIAQQPGAKGGGVGVIDSQPIKQRNPQHLEEQYPQKEKAPTFQLSGKQADAQLGFKKSENQPGALPHIGTEQGEKVIHHFF